MQSRPDSPSLRAFAAHRPAIGALSLFYAAYVAAGGFGQGLAIIPGVSITFWPPAGIFVGALLSFPPATWPWWALAACLAELTCNAIWFHNAVPFALIYFSGNALAALTAAFLTNRWLGRPFRMESLEEVAAFVVLGGGLAPVVSATVIATTDALIGKHAFLTAWPLVWLGDGSGLLISTPLTVAAIGAWRGRAETPLPRLLEGAALAVLIVALAAMAFRGYLPTIYAALPVLLWAALRFQLLGAAAALGLITIATAWFTVSGKGEFAGAPEEMQQRIIQLKAFLGICAISALVVAGLARQHREALAALQASNVELERRVQERTAALNASQSRLAAILNALPIGVALVDANGRTIVANEVYDRFAPRAIPSADPDRYGLWEAHDASGTRIDGKDYPGARALRGERVWPGHEFLYKGDPDRGPIWTRVAALPFADKRGEIIGATIVIADIDAEKRVADALRASEESVRLAQEAAELGAWDHNLVDGSAMWSDKARKLIGIEADAPASSEILLSRVHPDDRSRVEDAMERAMRGEDGGAYRAEYRIVLPDGPIRWVEAVGRVERDPDGAAIRAHGVARDVSERVNHEQRAELLMREVNHRSKNMLSLVQVIARQTAAEDSKDFVRRFEQRIMSLSAGQDLLINSGWNGVDMAGLVRAQLAHFQDLLGGRINAEGPPVIVNAGAAQALGLALHELSTNAGKYGALSNGTGDVAIRWSLGGGDHATRRFAISWTERGGPRVDAPGRKGFGTAVIARMSRLSLDAEVDFELAPEGLTWRLECLASRVLENGGSAAPHFSDMRNGGSTSGGIGHS